MNASGENNPVVKTISIQCHRNIPIGPSNDPMLGTIIPLNETMARNPVMVMDMTATPRIRFTRVPKIAGTQTKRGEINSLFSSSSVIGGNPRQVIAS